MKSTTPEGVTAHLAMVQGVISRMETNSFALKALTATLSVAILAFAPSVETPRPIFLAAGILPIVLFWYLDGRYLGLGRRYRALYDAVRRGDAIEPFSMDVKNGPFRSGLAMLSWSIWPFYGLFAVLIAFSAFHVER